jgi:hypothetical protein
MGLFESKPFSEEERDLTLCLNCGKDFVNPINWEEAGSEHWWMELECANCDWLDGRIVSQDAAEKFDERLDELADCMIREYQQLFKANMSEEINRFAGALAVDAILPEDFKP